MLSWAPFIGDPITVIAGIFKVPLKTFLLLVALAKTSRYILIVIFVQKIYFGTANRGRYCPMIDFWPVLMCFGLPIGHYKTCLWLHLNSLNEQKGMDA